MEKNHQKPAAAQLRKFLDYLPVLDQLRAECLEICRDKPDRISELLSADFHWAKLYELPFEKHLAVLLQISGTLPDVLEISKADDPQQAALNMLEELKTSDPEWNGGVGGKFEMKHLIGALFSVVHSFDALLLYGYYLNELVAMARTGNDTALLNAIRVDPSVVSCPTAADRICRAVVMSDKAFISKLQKALAGRTGKQARYLRKFRFLMQILYESNLLGLPTAQLRDLAFNIGAYQNVPGAEKNVTELIRKAKKLRAI